MSEREWLEGLLPDSQEEEEEEEEEEDVSGDLDTLAATDARWWPEHLHRLRGYISSLEDGVGVVGMIQDAWLDGAYAIVDEALAQHAALVEHARTLERENERLRQYEDRGDFLVYRTEWDEIAACVAELKQHLGKAHERIATLERERNEALQANEGKANLALHDALIARADRYEETLLWAIGDQNLGALIADKAAYEWWVSQIRARAALAGEDALPTWRSGQTDLSQQALGHFDAAGEDA